MTWDKRFDLEFEFVVLYILDQPLELDWTLDALAVLPGQKFANGQNGVKIWPEMARFRL